MSPVGEPTRQLMHGVAFSLPGMTPGTRHRLLHGRAMAWKIALRWLRSVTWSARSREWWPPAGEPVVTVGVNPPASDDQVKNVVNSAEAGYRFRPSRASADFFPRRSVQAPSGSFL
jgi:hypothetical protein